MNNLKASSPELNFGCNKCDLSFETLIKLQNHERIVHTNSHSSQTKDKVLVDKLVQYDNMAFSIDKNAAEEVVKEKSFETYLCFYCDKVKII